MSGSLGIEERVAAVDPSPTLDKSYIGSHPLERAAMIPTAFGNPVCGGLRARNTPYD